MEDLLSNIVYTPVFASKRKRWGASLVDYVLYFAAFIFICYFFGTRTMDENGNSSWNLDGLPGFIGIVVSWLLFFPVIESFNDGQTIGKALFRIKTVKEDGSRINFGTSFLRHFFDWVDYLPFLGICGMIVASNNDKKQRVGDLVAKTIVVNSRS
ncbi:hypothetical protein A4D02_15305 [Niastella koreensis]|uniref:RDD domain containing protein n=2 Tax=Niastella koreensis TaxID=354356 RepID=G8T6Q7_NIAKG|nr:RDD family protein [Niastella koreensis]AEV97910.1 RDD domain containing protein [Niastella koreensis GR20-10]OQP40286.1 hypothetical protein A4D02_15305 [Niastella koreensis]